MISFTYHNPTRIEFGAEKEEHIGEHIAALGIQKVLICYGSDRIKQNGLFNTVTKSLQFHQIDYVELGGIISNPVLSKVQEGITLAQTQQIQAVLAVGGGSVLDSAKSIAVGTHYSGDVWDFFVGKAIIETALPVFDIMTLAATGSEMNAFAVITNEATQQKYHIISDKIYPRVSIINPALMHSVSSEYLAYSAVDIIAHAIEGYFTATVQPKLNSRFVEAIIKTVMETTEILLKNPADTSARGEFAWAATQALNGLIYAGSEGFSYPNHTIEHALSALHQVAHGAGLAVIIPAWMKWYCTQNISQFERFATKIFGVTGAEAGITALESWFQRIGAPTRLAQIGVSASVLPPLAQQINQDIAHFEMQHNYPPEVIEIILNQALSE